VPGGRALPAGGRGPRSWPLTATAIVAKVGNAHQFPSGRALSAYLGLVPGQHSTGGKNVLLPITKKATARSGVSRVWHAACISSRYRQLARRRKIKCSDLVLRYQP
jgi:transposase